MIRNQQVLGSSPIAGSKILSKQTVRELALNVELSRVDPLTDPLMNQSMILAAARGGLLQQVRSEIGSDSQLRQCLE